MSYNTLFNPKIVFMCWIYDKISVCTKIIISSYQENRSIHISEKVNIWTFYIHNIFILICPKLKILKLINKEKDSTSVIVERYIFFFYQIYQSNIYYHKNIS